MVAHQIPNGHQTQHPPFPQPPHNIPNGHFPVPSPAMSNQSLPGPNGSVHNPTPHLQHQPAPYNGGPYGDPNMFMQPHYQPQYPPQGPGPQYNYQYFPNQPHGQMGGPGPATLHGYNGYPQNGYMPRQPVTHIPQPPQQHPGPPQMNGPDGMTQPHFNQFPPPGEGFYSHPSQPPPPFGQPDGPYQQNYYSAPPYQQQPHQFPAGHPYAQGHGYGFPPPQPMHNGPNVHMYNHPPPQFQNQNAQHSRPPGSKSLNPSAQVFRGPSSFNPSRGQHNHPPPASSASGRSPNPGPASSLGNPPANGSAVNGGHRQETAPASGGLGLSQMEPAAVKAPSESGSTHSHLAKLDDGMTPSMSQASGLSSTADGDVQTPVDDATTPTSETVRRPFGTSTPRPAKLGFGSVPKSDTVGASAVDDTGASAQTVGEPTPTPTLVKTGDEVIECTIRISKGRPSHESSAGVTFSAKSLVTRNRDRSPVQHVFLTLEPVGEHRKSQRKVNGKVLVSMGTGNDTPARIIDTDMVFGEVTVEDIPAIVLRSPRAEKPSVEEPVEEVKSPQVEEAVPAPAPVPAPKAKPVSWAALLKPKSLAQLPSDSLSAGPSSVRVSPSKSVISLATETDAQTEVDAVTPKSVAPSLPPSATASGAAPRPAFNYAAAAAIGRGITPQDELLKMLTDGLKIRPKGPPTSSVPRGLINTGNMCYANTILQVLAYCSPFSEWLVELGKRLPNDLARRQPLLEALIEFLREFAPGPGSGSSTPSDKAKPVGAAYKGKAKDNKKYAGTEAFIPENVYEALKGLSRFDALRRGQQEDAQEFLGWFIETLHEELLRIVSRTESSRSSSATRPADEDASEIARPVSPSDGWLEVGKKQKTNVVRNTETRESAVTRMFGGTLRSILHAPGQKDSVTLEPYQPIQLDIQSPNVKSITDALRQFNEPEPVPEYRSSKGVVAATKQVFIETFPPVLILHLKRFVYDHIAHDSVKKNKPIAYGTELVIPQEIISPTKRSASAVKYRLFGVDYHHGSSASGGHYTVAVSRQDAKGWIHFDDETYSTIAEEDVIVSQEDADNGKVGLVGNREKCAYLLFYQRVR